MTKAMYQVYVEGSVNDDGNLVGVAYKKGGSEPLVRKRVKLSTIGMDISKPIDRLSLGASSVGIQNITNNGLRMEVNYDNNSVYIVPLSNGGELDSHRVKYSFDELGLVYDPDSEIQRAKSRDEFTIQPPRKPLSDEEWSDMEL